MPSVGSVNGISSTTQQIQDIVKQYGCTQAQAIQILQGQSPSQVLQGQSSDTTQKQESGQHSFSVTLTKTDSTTGKTSTVTATNKQEIESYEGQGYAVEDNETPSGIKTPSGTLTTKIPSGNVFS